MKLIKYTFEFIVIILLFLIFKIVGLKISRNFSGFLFKNFGSFFRSKKTSSANLSTAFPNLNEIQKDKILTNMWINYGKIFAEYMFIKNFRISKKFSSQMIIENQDELEKIKLFNKPVIFISGHFNNFELMAMHLEKSGIDLAAIYRPLNNSFLNPIMEKIRKKYICKKQIKKGITGTKELLKEAEGFIVIPSISINSIAGNDSTKIGSNSSFCTFSLLSNVKLDNVKQAAISINFLNIYL